MIIADVDTKHCIRFLSGSDDPNIMKLSAQSVHHVRQHNGVEPVFLQECVPLDLFGGVRREGICKPDRRRGRHGQADPAQVTARPGRPHAGRVRHAEAEDPGNDVDGPVATDP